VLDDLRQRFAGIDNIEVVTADSVGGRVAEFDLVIVNSVIQYLTRGEFEALLGMLRGTLRPGGRLVVADVIPRRTNPLTDATALLGFAARGGFLCAAIAGLVRTTFSDYPKLRARLGIAHYDEAEILPIFAASGFEARRHARNMGHNVQRMTFVATAS
jgi:SAM-dependent methyltransferase